MGILYHTVDVRQWTVTFLNHLVIGPRRSAIIAEAMSAKLGASAEGERIWEGAKVAHFPYAAGKPAWGLRCGLGDERRLAGEGLRGCGPPSNCGRLGMKLGLRSLDPE